MPDRPWRQVVADGKRLVKQEGNAKWELGDLALEVAPIGDSGVNSGVLATLDEFAGDIGIAPGTLRQYRSVASAFPKHRNLASWYVYVEMAPLDNRLDLIQSPPRNKDRWTVEDVRHYRDKRPQNRPVPPRQTEEKVAQVKEFLSDPQVAKAALADSQVRSAISRAHVEAADEFVAQRDASRPEVRSARSSSDVAEVRVKLNDARYLLNQSLATLREWNLSEEDREAILGKVNEIRLSLDWLVSYVESGNESFDKELEKLLGGAR